MHIFFRIEGRSVFDFPVFVNRQKRTKMTQEQQPSVVSNVATLATTEFMRGKNREERRYSNNVVARSILSGNGGNDAS